MDMEGAGQPAESAPQGQGASSEFSQLEHTTVGTLYMVSVVGGVSTNLLLIITLLKDSTLLRGTSSCFHIILALANIGVVAPSPFTASSSFSGRWLYGDAMCQAYGFEGMFVGLLAIGSIICLCVERYAVSTRKPASQSTSSTFYVALTIINIGNALFWAVMPSLGWSSYSLDPSGTHCAIEWMNPDEGGKSYMVMICVVGFAIPMAMAVVMLYKAFPDHDIGTTTSAPQAASSSSGSHDGSFKESELRWLCLTFLVLIIVGWGPFAFLVMWAIVSNPTSVSMLAVALPPLACKFMTMSYPLAYNIANSKFRAGYLSMLGAPSKHTSKKD